MFDGTCLCPSCTEKVAPHHACCLVHIKMLPRYVRRRLWPNGDPVTDRIYEPEFVRAVEAALGYFKGREAMSGEHVS